ncbi:hypothetical protein BS50DRAFT_588674 [Corynespora cassiicola Philippines]|uniref:Uncharacterized protein n=1 Tax=Corynespora cassiicola Philippines TaxID=1448308 RepID=A0A2T2NKB6_CORCC|nr:hypothetical protein BS50DRAFT_588674 [Corynespora cassiicola Philippines]
MAYAKAYAKACHEQSSSKGLASPKTMKPGFISYHMTEKVAFSSFCLLVNAATDASAQMVLVPPDEVNWSNIMTTLSKPKSDGSSSRKSIISLVPVFLQKISRTPTILFTDNIQVIERQAAQFHPCPYHNPFTQLSQGLLTVPPNMKPMERYLNSPLSANPTTFTMEGVDALRAERECNCSEIPQGRIGALATLSIHSLGDLSGTQFEIGNTKH